MLDESNSVQKKSRKKATPKPPTQGVGVQGFKADVYASDLPTIHWNVLIHLPKFQAYVIEVSAQPYENVMMWIENYVEEQVKEKGNTFYDEYAKWHDAKGYWKNETPMGELI